MAMGRIVLRDRRVREAILPDTKGAFRFARERDDEVTQLPNPLPPRRAIN
jgi:hypothetical protein